MRLAELHERARRNRSIGLCTSCDEPVVPGRTMCERHLEYQREYRRRVRRERRAEGLCIYCGERLSFKSCLCVRHYLEYLEGQKRRWRERAH